jgi:hypothetical protein
LNKVDEKDYPRTLCDGGWTWLSSGPSGTEEKQES